ncbi:MAG: hypothetical protein Q7S86_03685 [bacterium]|nr:hypothetical protein [bacterium]
MAPLVVTTRDKKGTKFVSIIEAAYNKAGLSEEEAQRVNDAPGLPEVVHGFIDANRMDCIWREQNGVIYFSVTSDGTTGEGWITRLESKGFRIGDYAKQILHSSAFMPTNGVTSKVAVLKGMLFEDNDRITKKIRADADKRKLLKLNAEIACLIREKFTDEDIEAMGLWWIVAMHEPINDSGGDPGLLSASRDGDGRWLDACSARPDGRWGRESGFAFVVSQVSP